MLVVERDVISQNMNFANVNGGVCVEGCVCVWH